MVKVEPMSEYKREWIQLHRLGMKYLPTIYFKDEEDE